MPETAFEKLRTRNRDKVSQMRAAAQDAHGDAHQDVTRSQKSRAPARAHTAHGAAAAEQSPDNPATEASESL